METKERCQTLNKLSQKRSMWGTETYIHKQETKGTLNKNGTENTK